MPRWCSRDSSINGLIIFSIVLLPPIPAWRITFWKRQRSVRTAGCEVLEKTLVELLWSPTYAPPLLFTFLSSRFNDPHDSGNSKQLLTFFLHHQSEITGKLFEKKYRNRISLPDLFCVVLVGSKRERTCLKVYTHKPGVFIAGQRSGQCRIGLLEKAVWAASYFGLCGIRIPLPRDLAQWLFGLAIGRKPRLDRVN